MKYGLTREDIKRFKLIKRYQSDFFSLSSGVIVGRKTAGGVCIVSKKVARSAVARNRIKRQFREALRPLLRTLPPERVLVGTARKGAATASSEELRRDLALLTKHITS